MKYILSILILISIEGNSQKCKCDSGYTFVPTMGTTSLIIEANKCYPDSVAKRLFCMWAENMCMETQSGDHYLNTHTGHSFKHTFDKQNCKCNETEIYYQLVNDSMIIITKEKFIELNSKKHSSELKINYGRYSTDDWMICIPGKLISTGNSQ